VNGLFNCDGLCQFGETYTTNEGFHYVVGMPTLVMPTSGVATYGLIGASRPTYINDIGVGPGTLTGSLNVDFGALTVGTNLNVAMPDRTYIIGGSASLSGSLFFGFVQTGLTISGANGVCSAGCDASVFGFFAGSNAERAGLGYTINDFAGSRDVVGVGAFQKQ
jgi:hypothetical protein